MKFIRTFNSYDLLKNTNESVDFYDAYYDNNEVKEEFVIGDDTQKIIDDIISNGKIMNEKEFGNYYLQLISDLYETDKTKEKIITAYFKTQLPEHELICSKNIRSLALGLIHNRVIVNIKNIKIKILDDNIASKIDEFGKQILINLANYISRNYPNKKLEIAIGNQPISVAGDDGFRMTIPNIDSDVNDMFPYWSGVIPAYKKLHFHGVKNRILWTAHDFLHEFGHTLGLSNETETDKFAVKEVNKFVKWMEANNL